MKQYEVTCLCFAGSGTSTFEVMALGTADAKRVATREHPGIQIVAVRLVGYRQKGEL